MFPANPLSTSVQRNPSIVNNRNRGRPFLGLFSSVHTIREIIEPVILLILDLLTVVLLGLTFCVQSVSVVISVDNVISGLCKALSRNLAGVIASIPLFIPSESERKAISNSLVTYFLNIFWVLIAYKMNLETYSSFFSSFFYLYFAFLNAFLSIYIIKNEIQFSNIFWNRFILYILLILATLCIIYQVSLVSSKAAPVLILLLKTPINNVFLGLELLVKLFSNGDDDITITPVTIPTLPIPPQQQQQQPQQQQGSETTQAQNQSFLLATSNHGYNDFDNNLCCLLEILRLSLWTLISVYQYIICVNPLPTSLSSAAASSTLSSMNVSASEMNFTDSILHSAERIVTATAGLGFKSYEHFNARKDRWFYFLLLFHDFINLSIPLKRFSLKLIKDSIISTQFPKLTNEELSSLPADDRCSVCLCDHTTSSVRLPCSHILHQQCLNRILQDGINSFSSPRCPICRTEITTTTTSSTATGTAASLLLNDTELAMLAELLAGGNGGNGGRGAADGGNGGANGNNNGTNEIANFRLRDIVRIRIITPTSAPSNNSTTLVNNNSTGIRAPPATTPSTVPSLLGSNERNVGNQPNIAIIRTNTGGERNINHSEGLSNTGVIRISLNLSDLASLPPVISDHNNNVTNNSNNSNGNINGNSNSNNDRVFFRRVLSQQSSAASTAVNSTTAASSQAYTSSSNNDGTQYIRLNFNNTNHSLSSASLSSLLSAVANDLQGRETTIRQQMSGDVSPVVSSQNLDSGNRNAVTTIVNQSASSSSAFSSAPLESDISPPAFEEKFIDENNQILVSTPEGRNGRRKRSILQAALASTSENGECSSSKRRKKNHNGDSGSNNDDSDATARVNVENTSFERRNGRRNSTRSSAENVVKPSTDKREDALVNDLGEKKVRGKKRKHSVKEE
jgi:hypothetical protein